MSNAFHLAIPVRFKHCNKVYTDVLGCKLGNGEEGNGDVDLGNELTLHKTDMKLPNEARR